MWNHSTEGFQSSSVFSQGGYVSLKGRRSNGKGKTLKGVKQDTGATHRDKRETNKLYMGEAKHARESPNIKWEKEIQTGQACKEDWPNIKIESGQACKEDWPNIKIESGQACNGDMSSM
ncbi:hypothetical protein TNCV_5035081 [Trichonephila clavipes]|nr:hypothetical protein TNCV_5035081 [Trichonephila clavipes]